MLRTTYPVLATIPIKAADALAPHLLSRLTLECAGAGSVYPLTACLVVEAVSGLDRRVDNRCVQLAWERAQPVLVSTYK